MFYKSELHGRPGGSFEKVNVQEDLVFLKCEIARETCRQVRLFTKNSRTDESERRRAIYNRAAGRRTYLVERVVKIPRVRLVARNGQEQSARQQANIHSTVASRLE